MELRSEVPRTMHVCSPGVLLRLLLQFESFQPPLHTGFSHTAHKVAFSTTTLLHTMVSALWVGGGGEKSTTCSILFSLRWSAVEPLRSKRGKDHVALLGLARPPAAGVRLLTTLATGLALAVLGFNFHFVLF